MLTMNTPGTLINLFKPVVELDRPIESAPGETGDEITFKEKLMVDYDAPDNRTVQHDMIERLMEAAESLKPRDKRILFDCYGIQRNNEMGLRKLGNKYRLSHQAVNLVCQKSERKLLSLLKGSLSEQVKLKT